MKWTSIVLGALSLAVLDGVVSRQQASSNVSGFLGSIGTMVEKFLSPQVPAFSASTTGSKTTATTTTTPATTTSAPSTVVNPSALGLPTVNA